MRSVLFIPLILLSILLQSCLPEKEKERKTLPLSGGIQLTLHTTGGSAAMNESVQISDHWQLSSVGRRHGWVRKLNSDEQRLLVRAMQGFETLSWTQPATTKTREIASTLTAKGSGAGPASEKEARNLGELVQKLVSATRIASR